MAVAKLEVHETVSQTDQKPVLPVRKPRGAGVFYPGTPQELYTLVDMLLAREKPLQLPETQAVLVPHAGYVYSGNIAAAALRELKRDFDTVFVLAANHSAEANLSGVSIPEVSSYAIPGVDIPLSPLAAKLRQQPFFTSVPAAHEAYMIEVELPFLYSIAGRKEKPSFAIIPMIVGRLDEQGVQQLAEILNRHAGDKTVFVFSVDLSHFYPDNRARRLDYASIDAVLSHNMDALQGVTTDGNQVLMTLAALAEKQGWEATLMQYANSGDVTGDRTRVVGYAGIAFHEPVRFTRKQQEILLDLARETIEDKLESGRTKVPDGSTIKQYPILSIPRGVFVTLKKEGKLRGCIGGIISNEPLYRGVADFAVKAAVQDSRFKPVTRNELDGLDLSISVLEYPRRVSVATPQDYLQLLQPGRDGVILMHKGKSSTFLPQVWEEIPDPFEFLSNLCRKQGSPVNCWMLPETAVFKYSAYEFGEK